MRRRLTALALPLALLLGGCTDHGVIEGKGHDDAYTYDDIHCISIGQNACAVPVMTPVEVPECYWISYRDEDDNTDKSCVDQQRWQRLAIGGYYDERDAVRGD